jgi:hypothetical protein
MPLQTEIRTDFAEGLPGMKADLEPSVYAGNVVAGSAGLTVGQFAWVSEAGVAAPTGAGLPTGLVERSSVYPIYDLKAEGSVAVPAGWEATVAIRGRYFTKTITTAAVGHKLFAVLADGTAKALAAGTTTASGPGAGTLETGWTVIKGAAAIGDPIIVENFG